MEKITFNQLKEDYFNDDVCMAEFLASTPATGLTIEQAFYMYIRAMSWCEEDEFTLCSDGDYYDLVGRSQKYGALMLHSYKPIFKNYDIRRDYQ